jgi:hypothetical protein
MDKFIKEPKFRLLKKNDLPQICTLMAQIKPPIAGLQSKSVYSAMCHDALKDKRLVFLVAEKNKELIGFTLAIIDRKNFWKAFTLRHPYLSARIFIVKFFKALRFKLAIHRSTIIENENEHQNLIDKWIKSSKSVICGRYADSQIAHTQYTAVAEGYRKEGIGIELQNSRDRILKEIGVKQLCSNVNIKNIAGIIMNYRRGGWKAERKGYWIKMSRDI